MKATVLVLGMIEWALTLSVSAALLLFGAERVSQLLASRYVYGTFENVDIWLGAAGFGALPAIFLLIHPTTRWYTAAALTALLVACSLSSLGFGEPQSSLVPILGLACATIVQLTHRISPNRSPSDEERYVATACAESDPYAAKPF